MSASSLRITCFNWCAKTAAPQVAEYIAPIHRLDLARAYLVLPFIAIFAQCKKHDRIGTRTHRYRVAVCDASPTMRQPYMRVTRTFLYISTIAKCGQSETICIQSTHVL